MIKLKLLQDQINKAIEFTRDYDDYKITVLGFTDRTSSRDYNKILSDKRANAVYEALIKRGIAKGFAESDVNGEPAISASFTIAIPEILAKFRPSDSKHKPNR